MRIKNFKVHTIKIILDSSVSTSIVCKDVLHKRQGFLKDSRWSTKEATFNTTLSTGLKLHLLELKYMAEIYAKCYLQDKLLSYNLILGRY